MYLWHLIFSQYLFGRTISIFSVYIVDLFIYLGYFMLSLIYFVFPTSNNNIWNLELVKTLFLVLSMLGSFTLIMKEEENLYFTLPSSFFPSFHFFPPVLPRFITYAELSYGNVIIYSVVINTPFIHGFPIHDVTSNIFYFGLASFCYRFFLPIFFFLRRVHKCYIIRIFALFRLSFCYF